MAWTAPSPVPAMKSRRPLIVAMSGEAYAVSYGRDPGVETYIVSPVRLSSPMNRCIRLAVVPQFDTAALTITRSPSMTGDIVRPPCVVNAAHSSPSDRCQRSLPSLFSAITLAPTLNTYTLPVSGSAARDAHPARPRRPPLYKLFNLFSLTTLPLP